MATNISSIPAPSRDAQAALLRAGVGNWKLIYSGGKWKVTKVENIPVGAITYEQWSAEKKIAAKNAGNVDTSNNASSYQSMKAAERDPLGTVVSNNGLVADVANGQVLGNNAQGVPTPYFVYASPNKKDITVTSNWDDVRKQVIADYQTQPGGIDKLFTLLYNKKLIDKQTYDTKDFSSLSFNKGLQYAINRAGVDTLDKRAISGKLGMPTLTEFLSGTSIPTTGGAGGPKTVVDTSRRETTRPDADEEADNFFMENLGRKATRTEKDAYFTQLNSAEKKAFVKTTTTTGDASSNLETGSLINQTDKILMLGKIAGDAIAGTDLDTLVKSGAGAAQAINSIKTYANQYGLTLSDQQAMGYVVDNLKTGKDLKSTQAKLQKLSKIKYSNISDSIDDTTSVQDIASETMYTVSRLTGIPYKSLSVNHPIVQKALANNGKPGVMTDSELKLLIKTDPETKQLWLKTPDAMDEAASFATNILKTFGLM